ncbi:MAG: FAD-dependent oxidoreductase [Verrucomicrobiota bacterium]|jgi:heterodisulfide reductase subunit A-like polyferredoxin
MSNNGDKKIGAVLVQGGGIAGVQAALDLANSGFKVYLVERDAAIGGMMAHLDKTFPTGDCATCIVSPKLVECARNLNIEILTLSELTDLYGKPGNFKATVRRYPRYVDESKCTGCSECTQVCPVDIPDEFNRCLGTRKGIAKLYAQATPNIFGILKNGHSPCKLKCPAKVNVQGYVQLIKQKEYLKAVALIRQRNPLSAICGRICPHPCESECMRGKADDPIAIRLLKRFASDQEMEMLAAGKLTLPEEKTPAPAAKKVAIIGGGPAGLTAANDLAEAGFAVTVFEAMPAAGGMLRYGIPEYRLPKKVLDHEIEIIRRKGVKFVYNCRIGRDVTFQTLQKDYGAVFVSAGAQKSRKLRVDGEDINGVLHGIEFLREAASAKKPAVKERVLVIGGGNVAVDVARTALRLGAKQVEMVCLEQRHEMPAYPEEIEATLAENIKIHNGWGPKRILGNGSVTGIELKRCTRVFDDQKRFNPAYDENDLTTIEADQIIVAIGQAVDEKLVEHIYVQNERGCFKADPVTGQTSIAGVFAGGDSASGPASVIDAVAAGKRAAESIERYLLGRELLGGRFEESLRPIPPAFLPTLDKVEKKSRPHPEELAPVVRLNNFDEVEKGLTEEQALAEAARCLNCALCSECNRCVETCKQHAIDHAMRERTVTLEVGAVILTPGFAEFDASRKGEFGYGRYSNVVTSVQFERMLSAAGPFEGHVIRLSDGREARRIAWIQCVGSRDSTCGNEYCSSICCMMATKQALVAGDHVEGLDATIFYMDIRAHGKDFDQYYERARAKENIHYVKSIPSRIVQLPGSKDLRVAYLDENSKLAHKEFDLIVLSVGMEPPHSMAGMAASLDIKLNEFGFCATDRLQPLCTSQPGVFVGGAAQEPKDIPETVTQASGAASMAMELLASARNSLVTKKSYPVEHDVTDEEPRLGVFVCHCGINIAGTVDVEQVVRRIEHEPNVVLATHTMFTCADTSLSNIKDMIHQHRLNRIVVASCTPRTHEPLFRETLREAGLNPYLFELANIRDQCSWVHSAVPETATEKAIELVKMSIARARKLWPLEGGTLAVDQTGIVIGGGLSGMTAALALAKQGFDVHLIEQANRLGGTLHDIHRTFEHENIAAFTSGLIDQVQKHPRIKSYLEAEITGIKGHIGKFHVALAQGSKNLEVTGGAIIVATGAQAAKTTEYLYGKSDRVLTQVELEKQLHDQTWPAQGQNIVMIQCVGSRNEKHPYCSRICCSMAVKNALAIKKLDPTANVYVLYRDVRTYGFREIYYQQAREAGVVFIRYTPEVPPQVTDNNGLVVTLKSPDLPEPLAIEADNVVLSTGVEVDLKNNKQLSDMLKVPLNADGFYVEAHMKLRPVDFTTEGIFLCGLAHSPKFIDENIAQARAAAARAATVLSKTQLDVSAQVAYVDQQKCISCMTCVTVCPYSAPYCNKDGKGQIEAAKCMGCGICAAECPARAIQLHHFETDQFMVMIKQLFASENVENGEKKVAAQRPDKILTGKA